MKNGIRNFIRILIYVLIAGSFLFLFAMLVGQIYFLSTNEERGSVPLMDNVQQDLCEKFELPLNDPLCSPEVTVTALDFFPIVKETLAPINGDWATYDQVEEKLGSYQSCEPIVKLSGGKDYFRCSYNLGDSINLYFANFYENGEMFRFEIKGD